MVILMLIIKLMLLIVSIVLGIVGCFTLYKLPDDRFSLKKNYLRISIFSNLSSIIDFIMFWIVVSFIPPGDYSSLAAGMVCPIILVIYGIPCIAISLRLKKRFLHLKGVNVARMNGLNYSVVFKIMFFFVETFWLLEK